MSETAGREMTLDEWCAKLPADHLVNRELRALRWQPIETAPKDGTYIVAWCVHVNEKYAIGDKKREWQCPVIAQWIDHNGGGWTWWGMCGTFTHWMPLPPAPLAAGKEGM